MEKDKSIQKLNNNIFKNIYIFFRSLFYNKNKKVNLTNDIKDTKGDIQKDNFRKNIKINESKDSIVLLKQKFDNKMVDVKDIPIKEKVELLEMYRKEISQDEDKLKKWEKFKKNN